MNFKNRSRNKSLWRARKDSTSRPPDSIQSLIIGTTAAQVAFDRQEQRLGPVSTCRLEVADRQ